MSIFSAIGNVVSSGFHDIFGGGQTDAQKKKQQQQQAAQANSNKEFAAMQGKPAQNNNVAPTPTGSVSQFNPTPLQKVAPKPVTANQPVPLTKPTTGAANQPVVNANTLVKATSVPKAAPQQPAQPAPSLLHEITHNDITQAPKDILSGVAGTALGVLRAGEGAVSSAAQLPSAASHLGNYISSKMTGRPEVADPFTTAIDKGTKAVTTPIDKLQKATDEAGNAFGQTGADIYHPAQIAANVATLVPAAETALAKVPGVASKLGGVGDFIDAQKAIPTLRKAASVVRPANEVADGVSTVNPTHDADVIAQSPHSPVNNSPEPAPAPPIDASAAEVLHPQTAKELSVEDGPLETPAYQRQGKTLPSEAPPDIATVNDQLHENAATIVKEPAAADMVNEAFRTTGTTNPLSIVMHTLAKTTDKGAVRHLVQKLVPDATGNTLNRAVTHITGADNQADVAQALTEASTKAKTPVGPLGPVSDAPASAPDVTPAEAVGASTPAVTAEPAPVAAPAPRQVTTAPISTSVDKGVPAPVVAPTELAAATPGEHVEGQLTRENAPQVLEAAKANLKKVGAEVDTNPATHDVFSNPELSKAGDDAVAPLSEQELKDRYHGVPAFHGAADVAEGLGAMKRLAPLSASGDADASNAISNILEASSKEISGGARTTNYAKEFYDNLPKPAKVKYLVNNIDKVRSAFNEAHGLESGDSKFLPIIGDDPALGKVVEANIDNFLTKDENIRGAVADAENKAAANKEALSSASSSGDLRGLTKDGLQLNKDTKGAALALQKNAADMGRYYDSIAPSRIATQNKLGDLGRTLMLSSPTGRANDVITTSINTAHRALTQVPEAIGGKIANKVGGNPGKYISTLPSPRAFGRGFKYGLTKSKARFAGNVTNGDISQLTKADAGSGKGGLLSRGDNSLLGKVTAPLHRVVRSATEIATDVSEGLKESRIQQLASQQGKQLGYKGAELRAYTANATAVPTREMDAAGSQLRDEVNNMQDNPITSGLEKVSKGFANIPVVGEQLKNLTLPFTRWTGGQLWNNAVDSNVLGNVVKAGRSFVKGDRQGVISNLSKLSVNATTAMTVGYQLAKSGVIVHGNAQGYNDDGAYLHVDGRYIPAGFLGFFAPGIILGASTYEATSGANAKGSILKKVVDTSVNTLKNTAAASGAQTLTGEDNPVVQALQDRSRNGNKATGAVIAGQVASQYIPAAGNDVNAVLNNGLGPVKAYNNPNHEAALTKVEKGGLTATGKVSTAKDIPKSELNVLLNKIPVVSQHLPRNTGVAAPDLVDRTTRGDRDTGAELKTKSDAAQAAQAAQTDQQKGIPDPKATYTQGDSFNNAVENRIEGKHYDQAIQGLQQQLAIKQNGKDSTTKETQPIKDQIAQVNVLKAGNFDPSIRDLYKSTSLTEWRNMGDPTSDAYSPATYQKLFQYDTALAGAGVSGSSLSKSDTKYTAKTSKTGSGSSSAKTAAKDALKKITSNTLGDLPNIASYSAGNLAPVKITDSAATIPTIQDIQPNQLIKKRTISVSKA